VKCVFYTLLFTTSTVRWVPCSK